MREHALTVFLEVELDEAWERVARTARPLAQDADDFRALYERRRSLYEEAADVRARDADDVILAALGIEFGGEPEGDALIADERVLELHPLTLPATHIAGPKTLASAERLWDELQVGRDGTIVGYGGGSTTDLAGFVAATYMRGIRWISVPTTLVGQVDAGIGGKTGVDLPSGKNLVGAFHYPDRVLIDTALLETLPPRRAPQRDGRGRQDGAPRRAAALGAACGGRWSALAPCSRPRSAWRTRTSRRAAARSSTWATPSGTRSRRPRTTGSPHGEAVALGLTAALRLSGVELPEVLDPQPVRVDRERAWAALQRDKKARDGRIRLVLLEELGKPVVREAEPDEVRKALDELIAD